MTSVPPEGKTLKTTPGKWSKYIRYTQSLKDIYVPRKSSVSHASYDSVVPAEMTICVKHVKLSKIYHKYLANKFKGKLYLKLKWSFYQNEQCIQAPEAVQATRISFEFTAQYQFEVDDMFIINLQTDPVHFELCTVSDDHVITLASADMFIRDILNAVNRKENARIVFTNKDVDQTIPIASLELWFKFTCNKKNMKKLCYIVKAQDMLSRDYSYLLPEQNQTPSTQSMDQLRVTHSEIDHFSDNLALLLNRNKELKKSQSQLDQNLRERACWLRYKASSEQTLEEDAILHGKKYENVGWSQWLETDTANVKLRTCDILKPEEHTPELKITVVKLYFMGDDAVLQNEFERVYVEYSFLGEEGPEMETPFSEPMGTMNRPSVFNFTKTFHIDIEKNYENCKMLTTLIKNNEMIKFMVIAEPVENLDHPVQTCREIGFADVRLEDIIKLEDNIDIYQYEILAFDNPLAVLGYITIKFEGIIAMKKMALTIMAPEGYTLFV